MSDGTRQLWETVCNGMRRYRESKRFPRKCRVLFHFILIAFMIVALHVMLGAPHFSVTADYRAMERAHLVGPGQILGTEKVDFFDYDHLLIAEDEKGVILYTYDSQVWYRSDQLSYRRRNADIMVLAAPARPGTMNPYWDFQLPIVVFDNHPDAVRAEVEITMPGRQESYMIQCRRGNPGYLIGGIAHKGQENGQKEVDLLQQLADISSSQSMSGDMTVIPIRICLYDGTDTLLLEENTELYSVAYEAVHSGKEENP